MSVCLYLSLIKPFHDLIYTHVPLGIVHNNAADYCNRGMIAIVNMCGFTEILFLICTLTHYIHSHFLYTHFCIACGNINDHDFVQNYCSGTFFGHAGQCVAL